MSSDIESPVFQKPELSSKTKAFVTTVNQELSRQPWIRRLFPVGDIAVVEALLGLYDDAVAVKNRAGEYAETEWRVARALGDFAVDWLLFSGGEKAGQNKVLDAEQRELLPLHSSGVNIPVVQKQLLGVILPAVEELTYNDEKTTVMAKYGKEVVSFSLAELGEGGRTLFDNLCLRVPPPVREEVLSGAGERLGLKPEWMSEKEKSMYLSEDNQVMIRLLQIYAVENRRRAVKNIKQCPVKDAYIRFGNFLEALKSDDQPELSVHEELMEDIIELTSATLPMAAAAGR